MTIAGSQVPVQRAQIIRASDPRPPQAGGVQVLPTSVKVSGDVRKIEREREKGINKGSYLYCISSCLHKFEKDSTIIHSV